MLPTPYRHAQHFFLKNSGTRVAHGRVYFCAHDCVSQEREEVIEGERVLEDVANCRVYFSAPGYFPYHIIHCIARAGCTLQAACASVLCIQCIVLIHRKHQ